MGNTERISASINRELFETFEKLRKKYGEDTRSGEIQKAIEMRIKQWKRQELEKECKEASRNVGFEVRDSYEAQGKALKSRSS